MFFPAPVLVVRASMLMYPFRTEGRTAATKLSDGPLRPSDDSIRPPSMLSARSGSLRSPLRALNSSGLPRDPVMQIKRGSPRLEETSDDRRCPRGYG